MDAPATQPVGGAGAADAPGAPPAQAPRTWMDTVRMVAMQLAIMYLVQSFMGPSRAPVAPPGPDGKPSSAAAAAPSLFQSTFKDKDEFSLFVYVTPSEVNTFEKESLVWQLDGLVFGDWESGANKDGSRALNITLPVTDSLAHNGSLWAHVYCVKSTFPDAPGPSLEANTRDVSFSKFLITRYLPRPKAAHKKNLLTGASAGSGSDAGATDGQASDVGVDGDDSAATLQEPEELISYWHNDLTINFVTDASEWPLSAVPPSLRKRMRFNMETTTYAPVVYVNDFWVLREQLYPVNETVKSVPLQMTYAPQSLFKWQMMVQYADQQEQQQRWGTGKAEDQEAFKRMLLDTNPLLLGITFAVSLLHTIFDVLAFKNDIQFWRNRKDMEGLSIRSLFVSIVCQVIILLYLLDQETSWLILASSAVGLLIDIWKVRKVASFSFSSESKLFGVFPKLTFVEKFKSVSKTDEYDEMAFKYLSWALFPLLVCYAIYSLVFDEHKGWYSYTVNMLAGAVYTFGFIMMTPQLFINYKLKSVAHLPWRMLTYRALNTFIDDLFAFIIKMPTMHRLACFRDDLVFFIYLYQRWAYRVDMTRANSFGVTGEQIEGTVSIPKPELTEGASEPEDKAKDQAVETKKDK